MKDFGEYEKWITITTIMKTSERSKQLPREVRDQMFLSMRKEFAPSLTDDDVKNLEKQIDQLSKDVQNFNFKEAMKRIGQGDKKETFEQLEKLVGSDDTKKIEELVKQQHDKELV